MPTHEETQAPDAAERFAALGNKLQTVPPEKYNYEHFQRKHLIEDGERTAKTLGVQPGTMAPDFELPRVGGGTLRLSELRGRPVLLHFGSRT